VFLSLFPLSLCNQTGEVLNFSPISQHALSLFSISPQPNTVLMDYYINHYLSPTLIFPSCQKRSLCSPKIISMIMGVELWA